MVTLFAPQFKGICCSGLATDTLWDAVGDLVVGTGNDASSIISKGNQYEILSVGATTLEWISPYLTSATVNAATKTTSIEEDILFVTYTPTGTVAITLASATAVSGKEIIIKDAGGNATTNNITISTEGIETIDGQATYAIVGNYDSVTLVSDGTNWLVI